MLPTTNICNNDSDDDDEIILPTCLATVPPGLQNKLSEREGGESEMNEAEKQGTSGDE